MTKQFFTTIITGFVAQSLGPVPFRGDSIPYMFSVEMPEDFWDSHGAYSLKFKETTDVS